MDESLRERARQATVLYVDVYAYRLERGVPRYLVLQRRDDVVMPSVWQHVSGKLLAAERIRDGFARQVRTKTGQTALVLWKLQHVTTYYDDHYDTVMMVPSAACELANAEVEPDTSLHVGHRWIEYEEARALLAFPGPRECLRLVHEVASGERALLAFERL